MLRITAVSAGAVDYLLRGSGCAEHEHAKERDQGAELEVDGAGGAEGAGRSGPDAAGYFLSATEHGEAPGRWFGAGLEEMLGIRPGTAATEDDVRSVFGELKHPETGEYLGRPPRSYREYEARLAAALAKEPDATPERRREIELATRLDSRKAVAYYDLTFSPAKSVSVYYAALLAAGADGDAAKVMQAHNDAVNIALRYAEQHAAYTRVGYHGKTREGRSVGRYEAARGLPALTFSHSTNREGEPQIHTHAAVLNRVVTASDGQIRALDGKGFRPIKEALAVAYERALEQRLGEELGARFAWRPDGKAREILGVDPDLCREASTRRAQVEERVGELVEAYVDRHGYAPDAAARKAIAQMATLDTRRAKEGKAGQAAVREWGETRAERLTNMLDAVDAAAARVAREGSPDRAIVPDQQDRTAILRAAVEDVQSQYPTWTLGNLVAAIDRQVTSLPCRAEDRPAYIEAMARDALAAGNEYGVLLLTAPDLVDVPAPLRRTEDGRSIYRPHIDELYTTEAHLASERRVVVGARQETAPKLDGPQLEVLRVELAARGLGDDQAAAVLGVMSSGRAGDVLIGPAGAGKSRTVAELAEVWTEQFGGRVVGLATSQKATQVLAEDGMEAINTTAFLHRFTPDRHGEAQDRVRPGDLFVVDEAGMASTDELARISRLVEAGGGKILYTGDPHQLPAVGAGGLLDLLERDNGAFQLERVHRFRNEWERLASVRLRVGDTAVLREYEDRGRLHGGTVDEMQAAAVRGYLTDTMDGLDSLLIVGTNEEAQNLSAEIHERLVELGRVDGQVLTRDKDGNKIGAGDVIQARKNDRHLDVEGGGMVVNRLTYTVRGVDDRGRLEVEGEDGTVAHLPMSYVEEHVALAYASTIHSAQGRTVDTSHNVLGEQSTREDAYVALSRGRVRNTAYLTTEREPDAHQVERLATTPAERLATIMDNVGAARSAELERRTGEEEAHSLAWIGAQWDDVSAEYARDRYTDTLAGLLSTEQLEALEAEPGYDRLMRAVRSAELAGHNAEAVLTEAVTARELHTADSVANVLRARVRAGVSHRTPEQDVDPHNWTTFAAPLDGTVGQFAQELAVLASDRQAMLGQRVAEELPEWAVTHLGEPPEDPQRRQEWERRAGVAAAYRELRGVPDDQVSLGAAPAHEQTFHRALWQQAHRALGQPADTLDYYAANDAELREMRGRWEREQTWAPPYVAKEMQDAYELAESYRQDAVLTAVELETLPVDAPEREQLRAAAARAERLAEDFTERARQLEEIHDAREQWFEVTEPARVADQIAGEELERRGLPARPEPAPDAEQLAFFDITRGYQDAAREQQRAAETVADLERQVAADVERDAPAPSAEAEPVERVRWWNRWADRMAGHDREADMADHEINTERGPAADDQPEKTAAPDAGDRPARAADEPQRERDHATPEVDEHQLTLVDVEPTVEDRVQAQPLRQAEADRERVKDADAEVEVTLAEARRQARAAELQRQQREAAEQRAAEQREQQRRAAAEAERERRDQAEREAKERAAEKDRERQAEKDQQRQRERERDEPQIVLVQEPGPDPDRGGPGIG